MNLLKGYLTLAWLLLTAVTVYAVVVLGLEAGMVFISDFGHPWRAQFNTDFLLHVILVAAWIVWREPSRTVGILCAIGAFFGGVFSLLYLLAALIRAEGDIPRMLLGKHWRPTLNS